MNTNYISFITLDQIRTFLSVATTLNMYKSAEALFITQSAVSKRISGLEATTGLILFTKHKKVLRLTPAGQYLFEHLQAEYESICAHFSHAHLIQAYHRQMFTVGTDSFFPIGLMTQVTDRFQQEFPEMEITVTQDTTENVSERLLRGEFDVVLAPVVHVDSSPEIEATEFARLKTFVLTSADNPLLQRADITGRELLSGSVIIRSVHYRGFSQFAGDVYRLIDVNRRASIIEAGSVTDMIYAVLMNKGSAVTMNVSGLSASLEGLWDRVRVLPLPALTYEVGICRRKEHDPRAEVFVRYFREAVDAPENRALVDRAYGGE